MLWVSVAFVVGIVVGGVWGFVTGIEYQKRRVERYWKANNARLEAYRRASNATEDR